MQDFDAPRDGPGYLNFVASVNSRSHRRTSHSSPDADPFVMSKIKSEMAASGKTNESAFEDFSDNEFDIQSIMSGGTAAGLSEKDLLPFAVPSASGHSPEDALESEAEVSSSDNYIQSASDNSEGDGESKKGWGSEENSLACIDDDYLDNATQVETTAAIKNPIPKLWSSVLLAAMTVYVCLVLFYTVSKVTSIYQLTPAHFEPPSPVVPSTSMPSAAAAVPAVTKQANTHGQVDETKKSTVIPFQMRSQCPPLSSVLQCHADWYLKGGNFQNWYDWITTKYSQLSDTLSSKIGYHPVPGRKKSDGGGGGDSGERSRSKKRMKAKVEAFFAWAADRTESVTDRFKQNVFHRYHQLLQTFQNSPPSSPPAKSSDNKT